MLTQEEVPGGALVFPAITAVDHVRFLCLAVVGAAIGGSVSVALLKYGYALRGPRE
ncbi:hypothetical protein [Halarchaeum nitratireducens]|uniref:Uncharacterized protein n=1 Tax=Halarchaeum nitratireducens TaxID=489913 RepID=A0A830G810_9EURY|nr:MULTISPECIES: hypothetical protein [Halarchaeum]MBP2251401.1 hypothetical protein [Halarchaeum solikamskense]GGN07548.1 hypothetical protein GCM10009021_03400 [Halarchaeum nitratireducens]